ncbi:MAG TPA: aerotolerance regulator BatA [Nitrospiraceae bacterium]|nr:aerotolerance regulator BatA [Nitrospiraceae bacterium]
MTFQNPWVFILLPVAAAVLLYSRKGKRQPALRFSTGILLDGLKPTPKLKLRKGVIILRMLALILIIIALSRPQSMLQESRIETEGIDIVLAIDTSTSMRAEDFELGGKRDNRLEVVRDVVKDFISRRHSDRIGIVAFAANAYTVSPLTLDYGWLLQNLERVKIGMTEDGTAIGSGISSALNRLKDSEAKGKVVILLTDGRNNAGKISPLTAADAARALNIKVYTIGAGSKGLVPYPAKDYFGNTVYRQVQIDIDEETLKKIAEKTKALYYRATDTTSLRNIYEEIDKIEKTPIEEKGYTEYKELFPLFLIPALALLILEVILKNTLLRRIP